MVLSGLGGSGGLAGAALSRVVEHQTGPSEEGGRAVRPGLAGLCYDLNPVLLLPPRLTAALTRHWQTPEADGGVAGGGAGPGPGACLT